jgi:hypothetical protein
MIITKFYEVGISGKFQTRKFGTTVTVDLPEDGYDPVKEAKLLQSLCVKLVHNDIKTLAASDSNFVIIQAAAQEELDKYVKYCENVKKAESKRGSSQ